LADEPRAARTGIAAGLTVRVGRHTTTVEQAAAALARLEHWLRRGDPGSTAECASACSGGQDDPVGVARWVGTLADHLARLAAEVNSWS
jgi:hypothetical protein